MASDALAEVARSYADEFTSAEDLVALAQGRLAWRLRRSASRSCAVCGKPLAGARRVDAQICSDACRQRRKRARRRTRVNDPD